MSLDRRGFLKTLGVAGATIVAGKSLASKPEIENNIEFWGMLYDSVRCQGCQSCEEACAAAHNFPEIEWGIEPNVLRKLNEKRRTVVNCFKTTKGDINVKKQCMHCAEPACAAACLTQAMYKTKEGPVIWRGDKCMGCRYCMVSCPFDIPQFEYHSANPKIEKCDMCYDKLKTGGIPACAEACPYEAILFGKRRDLIKEARKRIFEAPDKYVDYIYGEHVAGGTGSMYLSPVPHEELKFDTTLQNSSYPELSKGFLFSVPSIFVLLPPALLGIYEATKKNQLKGGDSNE